MGPLALALAGEGAEDELGEEVPVLVPVDGIETFSRRGGRGGGGRFAPVIGETGTRLADGDRGKFGLTRAGKGGGGGAAVPGEDTFVEESDGDGFPPNELSYALYPGSIALVYVFSATFVSAYPDQPSSPKI